MKRVIGFAALMVICFGLKAQVGNDPDCYIKTGDKIYLGTELKMGLVNSRISLSDGTVAKVKNRDITAYRHHNKIYMKMPVICDRYDTICMAMMQYIKSSSEYDIFLYCCNDLIDNTYKLANVHRNIFFVFKDGKFYRRIAENQTEALLAYGIKEE